MLSHILGWTSNRTEFRKGMFLESPAGSYYEVVQAKKIKVSVVMNPDDDGFEFEPWMRKKKRETGKTILWEVTLRDLSNVENTFSKWMAIDPRTGGGRAWELNNHVIVTEEFAKQQANAIIEKRQSIHPTWTPCPTAPSAHRVLSDDPDISRERDSVGLDGLSDEKRVAARIWLHNNYLGDPSDESQVQSLLVESVRLDFELTIPIIREMMFRFHSHAEKVGTLELYRKRRESRDSDLERRREESKHIRKKTDVFADWSEGAESGE